MADKFFPACWLVVFVSALLWSVWQPVSYFIWLLEVAPALIGMLVLLATYRHFPLTRLLYALILLHMIILMIGGHYTYAEMPLFNQMKDMFGWSRNYYDRVGHFAQGFVPAMIAREILIRKAVVRGHAWLFFIVLCICLAISASYELIEWWVSVATGEKADAFLGTQGDVWDTQWDMFLALCGAVVSQLWLGKRHQRAIEFLRTSPGV